MRPDIIIPLAHSSGRRIVMDLSTYPELVVCSFREMVEDHFSSTTPNKYKIFAPNGQEAMFAAEDPSMISRKLPGTSRALRLRVTDMDGGLVLLARREFSRMNSNFEIEDGKGNSICELRRRFGGLNRRFAVVDPYGKQIAEVSGSIRNRNVFTVNNYRGDEIGRITKQLGGDSPNAFTHENTLRVQFSEDEDSQEFRLMLLATAFAIDLDFFD